MAISKRGWGVNGYLVIGNVKIPNPADGRNKKTSAQVNLQAYFREFQLNESERIEQIDWPEYYTVQFGITPPPSGIFTAEAIIEWVTNGNAVSRRVSVGNGVTCSGTAESVKVSAFDTTDPLLYATPPLGEIYGISILCTPGTRPSRQQPPTLVGLNSNLIAPAGTLIADIPQDAGVISVLIQTDAGVGESSVVMSNPAPLDIAAFDPAICGGWQAIPPSATLLTFTNFAAGNKRATITWGIEG